MEGRWRLARQVETSVRGLGELRSEGEAGQMVNDGERLAGKTGLYSGRLGATKIR